MSMCRKQNMFNSRENGSNMSSMSVNQTVDIISFSMKMDVDVVGDCKLQWERSEKLE